MISSYVKERSKSTFLEIRSRHYSSEAFKIVIEPLALDEPRKKSVVAALDNGILECLIGNSAEIGRKTGG